MRQGGGGGMSADTSTNTRLVMAGFHKPKIAK